LLGGRDDLNQAEDAQKNVGPGYQRILAFEIKMSLLRLCVPSTHEREADPCARSGQNDASMHADRLTASLFWSRVQRHDEQHRIKREDSHSRPSHDLRHSACAEAAVLLRSSNNHDGLDLAKM